MDESIKRLPEDGTTMRTEYPLEPCSHEEFDTRCILHAANASQEGHTRILIHANDTDVLVVCIAFFHALSLDELWIAFAQGKHRRYVPVHAICEHFADREMMTALPISHALTGSDTTSFLAGIGKKTAFQRWMTTPD